MALKKPPKPKDVNFELIPPKYSEPRGNPPSDEPEPYRILREVRDKDHRDIRDAKIALAWRKNLKPNVDGHLMLGKCVKASDLQKELAAWDFVILLNREVWSDPEFTPEKKRALIDHELCHAAPAMTPDFENKYDAKGRQLFRTRGHDIEEFFAVVQRHGCYKRDLERFAEAMLKKRGTPLFNNLPEPTNGNGHAKDETTVQLLDGRGKPLTPKMTSGEFKEACDAIAGEDFPTMKKGICSGCSSSTYVNSAGLCLNCQKGKPVKKRRGKSAAAGADA